MKVLGVLLLTLGALLLTGCLVFYLLFSAKDLDKYNPSTIKSLYSHPSGIPLSAKEMFVLLVLGFSGVVSVIAGFAILT